MSKPFAEQVREARTRLGLSQRELGDRLGITGASVSRWESGGEPDKQKLPEILAVLGLDRDDVLRGLGFEELFAERPPEEADATLDAIRRDTRLLPEARAHLLNQYQLLLRVSGPATEQDDAQLLELPRAARRRPKRDKP